MNDVANGLHHRQAQLWRGEGGRVGGCVYVYIYIRIGTMLVTILLSLLHTPIDDLYHYPSRLTTHTHFGLL